MVTKIVIKDIKNVKGEEIKKGEKVEVVSLWLNNMANDIYVMIKNRKGVLISTSVDSLEKSW